MSDCEASEPYALMVLGDSMLPEFKESDVIVIEPDGLIENEAFVVAESNGEFTFRQLVIADERYFLKPLNDLYPVVEIDSLESVKGRITQKKFGNKRRDIKRYV